MSAEYIVVHVTENTDLYTERFDSLERAELWLAENDDKAVLIKIEGLNGLGAVPTTITVEDHT